MNPENHPQNVDESQAAIEKENQNAAVSTVEEIVQKTVEDVVPASTTIPVESLSVGRTGNDSAGGASGDAPPVKRGRGRPKKNAGTPSAKAPPPRPDIQGVPRALPPVDSSSAAIEPCAEMCVMMTNISGVMLAGGEEGAMNLEEMTLAKHGYVAYFKAKGVENVPAWVVLAGSLAPYYLRIITQTKAKTTISVGVVKAWGGLKGLFKRKKKDARFDSGNNIKRENDISETTGEASLS